MIEVEMDDCRAGVCQDHQMGQQNEGLRMSRLNLAADDHSNSPRSLFPSPLLHSRLLGTCLGTGNEKKAGLQRNQYRIIRGNSNFDVAPEKEQMKC